MSFEELGDIDLNEPSDGSAGFLPRPTAKTLDDPIPAMREVRARIVSMDDKKEGKGEGDSIVLLEDPEGLAPQPAALSMWAYALAMLFDGSRSARAAAKTFKEKYGQAVPPEQALELQRELERTMFLHSESFEKNVKRQIQKYLEGGERPPAHAGSAYPVDAEVLRKTVTGFFSAPDGPGALDTVAPKEQAPVHAVIGMIAPHIDLRVGGATYAHAYKELLNRCDAELFIVLGVSHQRLSEDLFYVSQKSFATPLGKIPVASGIAARLAEASGADSEISELAHRTEHSVEFQAVLMNALLTERAKRDIEIVPILCGGIDTLLAQEHSPLDDDDLCSFAAALREELDKCGKKWCVLCSVDFSHVGPEFGHNSAIDERLLPAVERGDRRLLGALEKVDVGAFLGEIQRTQNSRHVDAVMAVLTMMKTCEGLFKRGTTLHYDQMLKKQSHSAVSYASLAFE